MKWLGIMITEEIKLKKSDFVNIWSAPGINACAYHVHVNGDGDEVTALVDHYGTRGAGRAAIWRSTYIKGIGQTPLVNLERPFYSTGDLTLSEAIVEAVHLLAISTFLNQAIAPLSVSATNQMVLKNLEHIVQEGGDLEAIVYERRYDHGALLVREIPIRLSHLEPMNASPEQIRTFIFQNNRHLDNSSYKTLFSSFLSMVADNFAILLMNRFSIGTTAVSNVSVHGVPFDTASSSFLVDFRNCWIANGTIRVWDEPVVILKDIARYLFNYLKMNDTFKGNITEKIDFETNTFWAIDSIWERALKKQSLLLLGLKWSDLKGKSEEALYNVSQALVDYLQFETMNYDFAGGYNADENAPKWVGNRFDKELPELVVNGNPTSSSALNEAYLALNIEADDKQIMNCKRICLARHELASHPNLHAKIMQAAGNLSGLDVEAYQDIMRFSISKINKLKGSY